MSIILDGTTGVTTPDVTSDGLTVDSTTLVVDETNNRVGINTDSPSTKLDIKADSNSTTDWTFTARNSAGSAVTEIGGYGYNHNLYHIFWVNDSEKMRITSDGTLLVGKTAAENSTEGHRFEPYGFMSHTRDAQTIAIYNRLTSDGTILDFRKDNTQFGIIGIATEAAGSGIYVGRGDTCLAFQTRSDNSISPFNAETGATRDNAIDLGNSAARFDDIFATNGTIQTSDRNEKQDIEALSEAEARVAVACKGLLRKFRWKDKVAEKGDEARIHFGIIAQDLQDAFAAEGLDAGRYGMFISSTWTDEETGEERTRLGVRYPELLAFIIGAI
jgi:hypothetical protein